MVKKMKYKIKLQKECLSYDPFVVEANTKDDLIAELLNFVHMTSGYYEVE